MRTLTQSRLHQSRFYSSRLQRIRVVKQRGVVLFFALIALLAISLAAVALIRSVDTSTMIAGNMAFKRATNGSGSTGVEVALDWLSQVQLANANMDALTIAAHPFNLDAPNEGYYSSTDPNFNLFDATNWVATKSKYVGVDASGNSVSYIIQRLCRIANQPVVTAGCLYMSPPKTKESMNIKTKAEVCLNGSCVPADTTPQIRITARSIGPKNTISYVQAFVY